MAAPVLLGLPPGFDVYTIALADLGAGFAGPMTVAGAAAFTAMWGVGGVIGPCSAASPWRSSGRMACGCCSRRRFSVFIAVLRRSRS